MKFNQRMIVGPRGGRAVQATPCAECVSWRSCRPAAISEPFGCESWADDQGRRALPDQLEAEPATPCEACQGVPSECGPCGCPEVEVEPEGGGFTFETLGGLVKGRCGSPASVLSNPDPEPELFRPAEAYRPDQMRGEGPAQSVLPMPDAGPLFAGCLEAKS
ncbi:MAG: hypothetical protein IMZ46_20035 [Acidobacteria bacterium]|nr:hypothetical protein [Acidobacteriota bacterium]